MMEMTGTKSQERHLISQPKEQKSDRGNSVLSISAIGSMDAGIHREQTRRLLTSQSTHMNGKNISQLIIFGFYFMMKTIKSTSLASAIFD